MCDGYSGYNKVSAAKRLACWSHIRRYLIDAIPKGKHFEKEDKIRQKYKTFDAIKEARLTHEKPIIEGFLSWLEKQTPVRNSRLDKAVTYIRNRKEHLMTYLEDGRCSFSNNQMTDEELEQLAPWNEALRAEIQRRADGQNNNE